MPGIATGLRVPFRSFHPLRFRPRRRQDVLARFPELSVCPCLVQLPRWHMPRLSDQKVVKPPRERLDDAQFEVGRVVIRLRERLNQTLAV